MMIRPSVVPGTALPGATRARAALILLALCSGSSFAQTAAVGTASALSAGSVAQVLFGLLLVLALLGGIVWLLKRVSAFQAPGGGVIRILAGAALGPRERIVLVEVGDTWLVVGVAPGHVSTLHTMPKMASPPTSGLQTPATLGASFATWLSRKTEGRAHE